MSDPIKMGCNHNEPKTTEPVPNQSNKTPVSHSQLINPPVQRSARSNEDLQPERFEQEGSHKRTEQKRWIANTTTKPATSLAKTKRSTYDPPPRVPVDTFIFSYCRGPRVIRNRGLQQQQQATAADYEITSITITITKLRSNKFPNTRIYTVC